jgi:hypothetical protein
MFVAIHLHVLSLFELATSMLMGTPAPRKNDFAREFEALLLPSPHFTRPQFADLCELSGLRQNLVPGGLKAARFCRSSLAWSLRPASNAENQRRKRAS